MLLCGLICIADVQEEPQTLIRTLGILKTIYCASRENKFYFASVKFAELEVLRSIWNLAEVDICYAFYTDLIKLTLLE